MIDDSDNNWWKGSNHRGEGLFPANFVTVEPDDDDEQHHHHHASSSSTTDDGNYRQAKHVQKQKNTVGGDLRKSVQFNEEVQVKTLQQVTADDTSNKVTTVKEISEATIDRLMNLLNEADPTTPETDPVELKALEAQVEAMGPLIDAELERVDRRHAELTRLSTELVDALNLYHQLMHEVPSVVTSAAASYHLNNPPPIQVAAMNNPALLYHQPSGSAGGAYSPAAPAMIYPLGYPRQLPPYGSPVFHPQNNGAAMHQHQHQHQQHPPAHYVASPPGFPHNHMQHQLQQQELAMTTNNDDHLDQVLQQQQTSAGTAAAASETHGMLPPMGTSSSSPYYSAAAAAAHPQQQLDQQQMDSHFQHVVQRPQLQPMQVLFCTHFKFNLASLKQRWVA